MKAVHTPFISGKPAGTDNPISNPDDVAGYLIATIKNTASMRLQVYRIEITFYFDKDERMIDYRAKTLGDW